MTRARMLTGLLPLLLGTLSANAQTSGLTGIVTDPTGSRLTDVKVTAVHRSTSVAQSGATNAEGEFVLAPLPPGEYDFTAERSGFQRYSRTGITLELGRTARLDVPMQIGQVSETVEVTAQT